VFSWAVAWLPKMRNVLYLGWSAVGTLRLMQGAGQPLSEDARPFLGAERDTIINFYRRDKNVRRLHGGTESSSPSPSSAESANFRFLAGRRPFSIEVATATTELEGST
jgi:hypothetical protein